MVVSWVELMILQPFFIVQVVLDTKSSLGDNAIRDHHSI